MPLRMSQTNSPDPEPFMSFGCFNTGNGYIMENRWMRVFPLAEQGFSGSQVEVRGINFVADSASSRSGSQSVQVRVYALKGELTLANLSLLGEATVEVADTDQQRISAVFAQPFNVPIETVLVAEVAVPDGSKGPYVQDWPEEKALCIFFHGDYDEIPEVRERLVAYARQQGLKLKGTCRNIYLEGPPHHKDKSKFVTQVALPLVPDEL